MIEKNIYYIIQHKINEVDCWYGMYRYLFFFEFQELLAEKILVADLASTPLAGVLSPVHPIFFQIISASASTVRIG